MQVLSTSATGMDHALHWRFVNIEIWRISRMVWEKSPFRPWSWPNKLKELKVLPFMPFSKYICNSKYICDCQIVGLANIIYGCWNGPCFAQALCKEWILKNLENVLRKFTIPTQPIVTTTEQTCSIAWFTSHLYLATLEYGL